MSDDPFDNPPEKRVPLNFRVASTTKAHVDALLDLYKIISESEGRDPKAIDQTWMAEMCLRFGVDIAWAKLAKRFDLDFQGAPSNPLQIAQMKRAVLEKAKQSAAVLPIKPHKK